jgi:hypothetical protein
VGDGFKRSTRGGCGRPIAAFPLVGSLTVPLFHEPNRNVTLDWDSKGKLHGGAKGDAVAMG